MAGKLTAAKVKALLSAGVRGQRPKKYSDGNNLYLVVTGPNTGSYAYRYKVGTKQSWPGLGSAVFVTLAEARAKAFEMSRMRIDGRDPLGERKAAKDAAKAEALAKSREHSFEAVAGLYIEAQRASWSSDKHAAQWPATLSRYVYPVFGTLPIGDVKVGDVMTVLQPIWQTHTVTASRVRQRIESVLDYATARGWRSGDNPARWRGHLENLFPAQARIATVKHFAALDFREINPFLAALGGQDGVAARALEFVIYTAARAGEAVGAVWSEIDLAAQVWTIPAERMKAGVMHRVPLSAPAIAVLAKMALMRRKGNDHVFPGKRPGQPIGSAAFTQVLKAMGRTDLTTHGFRSSFRDWAAENTNFAREVAEAALAHTLRDKTEAAYRRGDALEKRRKLMDAWAGYCAKPLVTGAMVTQIRGLA